MSLNVIFPISHADLNLAKIQRDLILHLGSNANHILTVMPTESVDITEARAIATSLEAVFASVEVVQVTTTDKTWPVGCNQHWRAAAKYAAIKNMPWYWLEADANPTRSGWLDELSEEYIAANKPHMGCVVPTRMFRTKADGTIEPVDSGETHLMGSGIYSPQLFSRSLLMDNLDRVILAGPQAEPFDIRLRFEIAPHAHHTPLIQHNFKTVNYRREGSIIVCDNMDGNPDIADHSKPIDPAACVVHGCKDGSLANLVMAKNALKVKAVEPKQESPATAEFSVPTTDPNAAKIQKVLSDGLNRRVKHLAEELKITVEEVTAAINSLNSGLVIAQLGWVKIKS